MYSSLDIGVANGGGLGGAAGFGPAGAESGAPAEKEWDPEADVINMYGEDLSSLGR